MKRLRIHPFLLFLPVVFLAGVLNPSTRVLGANMTDYCQVPPSVIQNVPPNILLMVDNSGSMTSFAYYDGFHTDDLTDDNPCASSTNPCIGFTGPGTYPTFKYYGYFNPDFWYSYSSNKFRPEAPKLGSGATGARAKLSSEWDGNFLNWLTMRRADVLRRVLTGGKITTGGGSGYEVLVSEETDGAGRGIYKKIANAGNYTPFGGTGNRNYVFSIGSSTPTFTSVSDSGTSDAGSPFRVQVLTPIPVQGVLQTVVGDKARVGLGFYAGADGGEGGRVRVPVSGGSLSSTVNEINLTRPNGATPLGEALWSMSGYFAQVTSALGGPGPRYSGGDYNTNNNDDPLNYGTGGQPRWPLCAKSFVLMVTDGEPCYDGNLPASLANYASGKSAFNCSGGSCPAVDNTTPLAGSGSFAFPTMTITGCGSGGVAGLEDVALYAHTTDLRNSPTFGTDNIARMQNLTLYVVYAFGKRSSLLKFAAINGGFEDIDGSNTPNQQAEWDGNSDGEPDSYYEATDGATLEQKFRDAFQSILKRAASGTAASVLASGEGSGASLIQALYYPRRRVGNEVLSWSGAIKNLWYFVDPFLANAYIREETNKDNILNLANDYIAQFYYDPPNDVTKVRRFPDTDGNGTPDATAPEVTFEDVGSIWDAGNLLWSRDITTAPRTIYTTTNGSSLIPFSVDNAALVPLANLQAANSAEREKIIRFVHGQDIFQDANADQVNDFRLRTVTLGTDNVVYKMGDIINSTPRIVAGTPLNTYDKVYLDRTYKLFLDMSSIKNRGMVFTGGNDGMLHAFKLGKLDFSWMGQGNTQKARISNPDTSTPLGHEAWAFIPKNAQPYLKYLMDPDYCNLYYAYLPPFPFDASINGAATATRTASSWRTVLIGGMRTGGACKDISSSCTDCVKTPVSNQGFSSYFALDVTDPASPTLLWEFSNPDLGFATTGPAVVRLNANNPSTGNPDRTLNGKWYIVFGSGPTGGIDTTNLQFLGKSSQNLKLFVLDLKTGTLLRTIDTGITNAFAGSMINITADTDLDYEDDAFYIGYTKKNTSTGEWDLGGIGRVFMKGDTSTPLVRWEFSKVIDDIGPVTTAVSRLQNNTYHHNWLFFGTGRYFFTKPPQGTNVNPVVDDGDGQRRIISLKDPCFTVMNTVDTSCTTTKLLSSLTNVTSISDVPTEATANGSGFSGWYINLDASGSYSYDNTAARPFFAERMVTDPLASPSGLVYFTTFKPYGDECAIGGKTFLWATRYNTGGTPPSSLLKGKALMQVSTASIEQLDLTTAFQGDTALHKGGRRTFAIEGVPPASKGLSILSPPRPLKKILHLRER